MRISPALKYSVDYEDVANEFCNFSSCYQADAINLIGTTFSNLAHDPKRTATQIQMLEIAEQLNDKGKWFIETLCEYMGGE